MIPLTAAAIAAATDGHLVPGTDPSLLVTAPASIDSRQVHPGGVFAALPGRRTDGHYHASAALAAGAALVLAARPVPAPAVQVTDVTRALGDLARHVADRLPATVIGITGSNGKTTTKDLATQVLAHHGPVAATDRSFNNELGFPLTVLRATPDTRYLILEMGARGRGHLSYLCGLVTPHVGVVLNVGTAHLGQYPDGQTGIAAAKSELLTGLPSADHGGLAILNADDPLVAAMAPLTPARTRWWSQRPHPNGVYARDVHVTPRGRACFTLHTPEGTAPVTLRLTGRHHVGNALAVAALALGLGLDHHTIADALSAAEPASGGRMQTIVRGDGVTLLHDAYNANPDSMAAALTTLSTMSARRRIAVLGEMADLGDHAAGAHHHLGVLAARAGLDVLITIGTRTAPLIADAADTEHSTLDIIAVPDSQAAHDVLSRILRPDDLVLIKASRAAHLEHLVAALSNR
ncbi:MULTISPECIES: UDP-N-acetylmuramoyl-tripeptide--D-alanyl-D-alanine ligase [Pseudonocardiaceae]|uniref:UDP-N-acetylmuramoyl-tripeptide--D-alanyl-D-alanine ligase n=10 Tax=Pseudonocardiaceae TaxID=2070 RepID=A0A2V4AGJ4_9PSEU|nr:MULTISPECIES: UDP-N-acetylmuramoyl-tripeptide--D-alanyl-D-alanine ligase [Pseudonocardiaceae]PXY18467.1 UDP-N-acetylmuramoyl-tripeptide--D-alanyl-D-alanine ligase [Prauserella coralliicola]AXB45308.1 UDP-N-acetylmuramoyl-tripeptide--D-alanyl-D-alanine ligase [Amycolatopsis albispora]EHR61545.1 UDP-N-acetylmuramoyl-tripeptide--D-alanyl-D-alanine ligase [Saccharomonospora cyanea NA-134]MBC3193953.1 UDP-N-acetylmuramoyl-tripeptide--D-alanyl-D-alanine ligase [Pseudonocardia sp. C8]MBE1579597.1 